MKYDILLVMIGDVNVYEVVELNSATIDPDQLQVGEWLSESEVDDLLQMGFKIEFKEFQ